MRLEIGERFGAAIAAAITLHFGWTYWLYGKIYFYPEIVAMDLAIYALAFGLLWLALADTPKWRHWIDRLVLAAVLLTAVAGAYVWTQSVRRVYSTDVIAFEHYAAKLILQGTDPYTVSMLPAFRQFHVSQQYQTLTWDGRIVDRMSYPAGSFLIFVPFVSAGVRDLRWVLLLFHLATIGVLYAAAPAHLRLLVLLPLFASSHELISFTYDGVVDFPWVVPLLLSVVWQRRPILAGACYGAACAIKQEPWILAPFLVVSFLRDRRQLEVSQRLATLASFVVPAAALFLIINGPFIGHDARSWALGTLEPAVGNLIPLGEGPSVLTQMGLPLPADIYTLAAVGIFVLLVVSYAIFFERLRDAAYLFPMIITWFMPRSLHNYFIFWIPVLTLVLALRAKDGFSRPANAT